jgi:hypothetical protein
LSKNQNLKEFMGPVDVQRRSTMSNTEKTHAEIQAKERRNQSYFGGLATLDI